MGWHNSCQVYIGGIYKRLCSRCSVSHTHFSPLPEGSGEDMVIILMPLQSSLSPHGETPGSRVLRSEASCSVLLDVRQQSVCDDGVSGPPPLHRRRLHLVDSVALPARPPICKPRHSARLRERSAITKEKEKPSRPDHAPYLQDNRRPSALRVKSREKSIGIKVRRKVQSDYYRLIMFWVQSGFACPSPASVWG